MPPTSEIEKRCLKCGYILEGLPEPRCPECGQAFDPSDPLSVGPLVGRRTGALIITASISATALHLMIGSQVWRYGAAASLGELAVAFTVQMLLVGLALRRLGRVQPPARPAELLSQSVWIAGIGAGLGACCQCTPAI